MLSFSFDVEFQCVGKSVNSFAASLAKQGVGRTVDMVALLL